MIEMTWLQLAHPEFGQAVGVIWDCPMLDGQTSYTAHRIRQQMVKVEKEIKALRMQLCEKYGKKDEKGKLINDARGFIQFENEENGKKFEEEFTSEFSQRKLTIKVSKLDFQKLTGVRGITPRMWEQLEAVCDNLPKEEEDETPIHQKIKFKDNKPD